MYVSRLIIFKQIIKLVSVSHINSILIEIEVLAILKLISCNVNNYGVII